MDAMGFLGTVSGAIPYRRRGEAIDVLLVTSVHRRRWIVPKGRDGRRLTPQQSAAREVWEEAGVVGRVSRDPIGRYVHRRRGDTAAVRLFALEVDFVAEEWPERARRDRQWIEIDRAASLVDSPKLRDLLRQLKQSLLGLAQAV